MPVQFGTDGIRGIAGVDVTVSLAYRLGRAVATIFGDVPIFVGFDTRESSPELAQAALAGIVDGGATGVNLGVFTTPGVAIIAEQRGGAGIVVSASHNPYEDNGLKVLGLRGQKLSLEQESELEEVLARTKAPTILPAFEEGVDESAKGEYLTRLRRSFPSNDFSTLRIVLDCANGAASYFATELFGSLGANVETIHASPTGTNINEACGSTHPEDLVEQVLASGADLGLAFDGDADRLVAVDAGGGIRDGDDLMVLFALDQQERGLLGAHVVVTSMSNLGLHRAFGAADISLLITDVGDRNVLMALEKHDLNFGGEQSGHLIFRSQSPTGDGMLTGLMLCDLVARKGALEELADDAWKRVPQAIINIPLDEYSGPFVADTYQRLKSEYSLQGSDVRIVSRPSGTEPVFRVMVESVSEEFVRAMRDALA